MKVTRALSRAVRSHGLPFHPPRAHDIRLLALSLALVALVPSVLRAQTAAAASTLSTLEQRSGAPLEVSRSPATGLPTYIGTRSGHAIPIPAARSASAEARANAFVDMAAGALGLTGSKDLERIAAHGPDEVALDHVRYRQTHRGIPVASAELIVHLRGASATSINGHLLPGVSLDTIPTVSPEQARAAARKSLSKPRDDRPAYDGEVAFTEPRLEVLNLGFFQRRTLSENRLAWFLEARGPGLRERIWIDAHDGKRLLQFSQLTDSRNRLVYTASGGSSLPGTLVRSEGQGPSGNTDVDYAYDYSGDTYDYYFNEHGRDSYDAAGATLSSTVHWCDAFQCGSCPCANAFWDGTRMVYGDGFSAADDVVAHELTHAVTDSTADLVYCLQSGALNESFSDIFGETVDLGNAGGTDTLAVRWEIGEDIPGIGAIRNMSDPTLFGDPGKVTDSQFVCAASCDDPDNGGVHTNSGVPNHAYALMVDGGSYNGFTISGIGLAKAGKIQYRALTQYLTNNALFLDDYNALNQSCTDLIGTGGITAGDCTEVMEALQAVGMNGALCVPAVCGNGTIETGEDCDDSNTVSCDGCDANCTVTACGNGVTACGEECDDGNTTGGDGCEADCTLSEGCALYTATDVPQNIPDVSSITSTINVPAAGKVVDVNIVNLEGTHTYVSDLEFRLASPAGTSAAVIQNVCGNRDNFDLGLDDEAPTSIPCPPTDGLSHFPSNPLSLFDGQPGSGNWVLTVSDDFSFDVGTLDSWGLLLCSTPCGNGLPDAGEECDDANSSDTDGCTNDCTICGNGVTTAPEECDDGDLDDGDGCDSNCTVTACGNGVVTAPEECDDGNTNDADLCANDCTLNPTPTPTPTPTMGTGDCCVDHGPAPSCSDSVCAACVCGIDSYCCTVEWDDICAGEAHLECAASCPCSEAGTPTPSPTPTGTPAPCAATPIAGCATPGKSILMIKDKSPAGASIDDKLAWKWLKGPALSQSSLGNPPSTNGFRVCVYDSGGLVADLKVDGAGLCDGDPCWKAIGDRGYKYKDRSATSDGVFTLIAKGGDAGKSKIILKGRGSSLPMPSLPLDDSSGVTVQLLRDDVSTPCWQADYPSAIANETGAFKAKVQSP